MSIKGKILATVQDIDISSLDDESMVDILLSRLAHQQEIINDLEGQLFILKNIMLKMENENQERLRRIFDGAKGE